MVSQKKRIAQRESRFQGSRRNEMLRGLIQLSMFQINNPNKYEGMGKGHQEVDFDPENFGREMDPHFGLFGGSDAQDKKNAGKMEKELVVKLETEKTKLREKKEKIRQRKIQQRIN
jgi:hypothetical protein